MRSGKRTLLANSDASVGSNAFLLTLMSDLSGLSLFLGDAVFAGRLSFDLAIATVVMSAIASSSKSFGGYPCPDERLGHIRLSRQNAGGERREGRSFALRASCVPAVDPLRAAQRSAVYTVPTELPSTFPPPKHPDAVCCSLFAH